MHILRKYDLTWGCPQYMRKGKYFGVSIIILPELPHKQHFHMLYTIVVLIKSRKLVHVGLSNIPL